MSEQRWTIEVCPICDAELHRLRPDDTPVCFGRDVEHERAVGVEVEVVPAGRLAEVQQDLGELRLAFDALEDRLECACEALEEVRGHAQGALEVGGWDVASVALTRILAAVRSVPAREETRA